MIDFLLWLAGILGNIIALWLLAIVLIAMGWVLLGEIGNLRTELRKARIDRELYRMIEEHNNEVE